MRALRDRAAVAGSVRADRDEAEPMSEVLDRNCAALRDRSLAMLLRHLPGASGVEFAESREPGVLTATVAAADGRTIALASRYRPLEEAERFAAAADVEGHAAIVCLGFAMGYHVRALLRRLGGTGLLIVYEPDAELLRTVLEHVDCSDFLGDAGLRIRAGDAEEGELTADMEPFAGTLAQGVQFLTHPPARQLHADAINAFMAAVTRIVGYCRTQIATTLVQSATTCRNLTANAGHYAAAASIDDLAGAAAGRPAVVVAAGPSLARNVALLAGPGVRDRVVIIAAQTVLKPLLERGICPHFVTALDYHEISRRFYEDLPASVAGVTMVAEAKVNPAVLDAFPGPVRVVGNAFLDKLLDGACPPRGRIAAGSTVAHLSFYLAQHLGCDPIILIGQDLGFSDGLYYCPGTAIHDVWAGELGAFNTLETMELKRIVRHKRHLQKRSDIRGVPIYSDEQMLTYLKQFERDFAGATQQIIDATEGGLPKANTVRMTLAEALDRYTTAPLPPWPEASSTLDADRLDAAIAALRRRRGEVARFRELSRQTTPILRSMIEHQRDPRTMQRLFGDIERKQAEARDLSDAFEIINHLNQIGAYNRLRADRAIQLAGEGDAYLRQRRQLERDIENVDWICQAADEAIAMFDEALARIAAQRDAATITEEALA